MIEGSSFFGGRLENEMYNFNVTRYFHELLFDNNYTNHLYLLDKLANSNANRSIINKEVELNIIYSDFKDMCGIVGYIGNKDAVSVLIKGLQRLEYRGYDSAGIACIKKNAIQVYKTKGKVSDLKKIIAEDSMSSL